MPRAIEYKFVDLAAPRRAATMRRSARAAWTGRSLFLAAATAVAGVTAMSGEAFARNFGPDAEPVRYPEPDVVPLDDRFKYKLGNTPILRLYRGTMWAEGPAWNGVGRYLLWSDIPADEQLRWIEEDGHVSRQFRYSVGQLQRQHLRLHRPADRLRAR